MNAEPEVAGARDDVFRLYSTCKLVKGGAYSAIYDLDRRLLFRFDSAYYELFALIAGEGIGAGELDDMVPEVRERCLEAIAFLEEREVGRYLDRVSSACLSPLNERWDSPYSLLNALVDVDDAEPDWSRLISELDSLQCRSLQIRCFSSLMSIHDLRSVLDRVQGTSMSRVEFLVRWTPDWDKVDWPDLFERFRNLIGVRVHSAPRDQAIGGDLSPLLVGRLVAFQVASIDGAHHCGAISEGSLNIPSAGLYSELKSFNGCLNRKLSIRADGEICNCPSMRTGFGKDLGRIRDVVASEEFQRAWRLKKDDMLVCRQCEFRYVCTDCRAYLESDMSLAKPARCNYDPVSGTWSRFAELVA